MLSLCAAKPFGTVKAQLGHFGGYFYVLQYPHKAILGGQEDICFAPVSFQVSTLPEHNVWLLGKESLKMGAGLQETNVFRCELCKCCIMLNWPCLHSVKLQAAQLIGCNATMRLESSTCGSDDSGSQTATCIAHLLFEHYLYIFVKLWSVHLCILCRDMIQLLDLLTKTK